MNEHPRVCNFLITERDASRVFETCIEGSVIWEYINRYDADERADLAESRSFSQGYLQVFG